MNIIIRYRTQYGKLSLIIPNTFGSSVLSFVSKWLAEQLGKSTCSVSKWCQNTVQPDLQTLQSISKLLDVDIRDLIVSTKSSQQ